MKTNDWFYSGTSGLVLPVKNKQLYPAEFQDKSRLTYYASLFNSIEINSSFYKIPMASTVAKWAGEVPDYFRFTFKLWREITHQKGLVFSPQDVEHFIRTIDNVGDKKGCLLVQFPPSFKLPLVNRLNQLLTAIRDSDPEGNWKVLVEFRHNSWYHDDIYELLDSYGAGIVVHDKPSSETPFLNSDLDFAYLRFHGPNGDYRGIYSDDFIMDYAERIRDLNSEGKKVFVYFNNTMGDAIKNLISLNQMVNEEVEI